MKLYKVTLGCVLLNSVGAGVVLLHASEAEYENKERIYQTMQEAGQGAYRAGKRAYDWIAQKGRQWYAEYKRDQLVNQIEDRGGTDFSHQNLAGIRLTRRILSGLNFAGADLTGVDLSYKDLSNVNFAGAELVAVNLTGAQGLNTANLTGAKLHAANLSGLDLSGVAFPGVVLNSANLERANLVGVNLSGLSLHWAHLDSANLANANLARANLKGADLRDANLTGVNFTGANLERVRFSSGTNAQGAIGLTLEQKCAMHRVYVQNIPWAPGEGPWLCGE